MLKKGVTLKTKKEIDLMAEGGRKLARIKNEIKESIKEGVRASEIEKLANKLIKKEKGTASFKMVNNYKWATCVNVNEGIVHGIPHKHIIFRNGDIVSVDIGLFYKGFHTDTSFSVGLGVNNKKKRFLENGKVALEKAIEKTQKGNKIYDISGAIESFLKENNLFPIRALVGHGIGKSLHEEPQIPCFTSGKRKDSEDISNGMVFAIEVMYTTHGVDVILEKDGWTISTKNGKISGLFEETVAVISNGPCVLTKIN